MNAAAKLLNQGSLSRGWVVSLFFARVHFLVSLLTTLTLFSALGIIYTSHYTRNSHAELQNAISLQSRLELQASHLLLEKSNLLTQSRIEKDASNKLSMVHPNSKNTIILP